MNQVPLYPLRLEPAQAVSPGRGPPATRWEQATSGCSWAGSVLPAFPRSFASCPKRDAVWDPGGRRRAVGSRLNAETTTGDTSRQQKRGYWGPIIPKIPSCDVVRPVTL
jgi:hypothetical protein